MAPARRSRILFVTGAVALLLLLSLTTFFLLPGRSDEPRRHHGRDALMLFDYSNRSAGAKTIEVGLSLTPGNLEGAQSVALEIPVAFEQIWEYPDHTAGTLACETRIRINGQELVPVHHGTYGVNPGGDRNPRDETDRAGHGSTSMVLPTHGGEILHHLDTAKDNGIQATMSCTPSIMNPGNSLVIIRLGPPTVLVK